MKILQVSDLDNQLSDEAIGITPAENSPTLPVEERNCWIECVKELFTNLSPLNL